MDMLNWKTLERHPLSAEYADLSPDGAAELLESIRAGVFDDLRITIHEGKVLDGWQRLMACIAGDIEPKFQPLPEGWEAEAYVASRNDVRRHESQERIEARANRRRQRVAESRVGGKSIRSIAAEEGVSKATIERDLEAVASTVPPGTVAPKSGKVTGKDKKLRNLPVSSGGESVRNPDDSPDLRCGRCKRMYEPPSTATVPNCQACKDERQGAKKGRTAGSHETKAPAKTAGRVVFDKRAFDRSFGDVVRTIDRVERGYGKKGSGDALRKELNDWLGRFHDWRKECAK